MSDRSIDPAAQKMLKKAAEKNVCLAWDRYEKLKPICKFGSMGICCRICDMGPCRLSPGENGAKAGACGAGADLIAARHLIRQVAAGVAAHSDHGRDIVQNLLATARGEAEGYEIKNPKKLRRIANEWKIEVADRSDQEIAEEVAEKAWAEWGQQEGELKFIARAPKATQERWHKYNLIPRGIDREIVETLHRTHEGVDSDYRNLLMFGLKTSMGDGWGGAMISTELSDVMFGAPKPVRSQANLGVLKSDEVNVVVHGHEPTLSEMVVAASRDPELIAQAKKAGAKGIVVGGICCTANEILMRQGAPVVGNFLHQELSILTGAVDLMLVDVQCIMPNLGNLTERYHTKLVTTSPKAKMPRAEHIEFEEKHAYTIAKKIISMAIENYANRGEVDIPSEKQDVISGFTVENTFTHLGGRYRPSFRPLNNAIIDGRLRGVAAVIGCNTVKKTQDDSHFKMVKEFLKNDVLVVQTGCSATACAKKGLLVPEAALEYAGEGLQEICRAVGIPPVLHLGSCVDNSRILIALCEMINEGGLGVELKDLPIAGSAPEAMCEKAIAIGFYCVASGAYVNYAPAMRVLGAPGVTEFLTKEVAEITGGRFDFEEEPVQAAHNMMDHIDCKRKELGLGPTMYAVPYEGQQDVNARREVSRAAAPAEMAGAVGKHCPGGPGVTPEIAD